MIATAIDFFSTYHWIHQFYSVFFTSQLFHSLRTQTPTEIIAIQLAQLANYLDWFVWKSLQIQKNLRFSEIFRDFSKKHCVLTRLFDENGGVWCHFREVISPLIWGQMLRGRSQNFSSWPEDFGICHVWWPNLKRWTRWLDPASRSFKTWWSFACLPVSKQLFFCTSNRLTIFC